jgi:tetratricopeptide (TPR) repeat protein
MRRFAAAVEADAWSDARACLDELRGLYGGPRGGPAWLDAYQTTVMIGEGRYPDALALLTTIDRARLHPSWHPWILNNLAFTLAHTGNGARAVTVARESLDLTDARAGRPSDDLRRSQLATLGAALVVAGRPEEGMSLLEEVLASGGRPRALAARWFFLGEARRAIGRNEDAVAAYRRSMEASPSAPHAQKAKAALEGMKIYR